MPGANEHRVVRHGNDPSVLEPDATRDRSAAERRALMRAAVVEGEHLTADPDDADPEPIDFDDAHLALLEAFDGTYIDGVRPLRH